MILFVALAAILLVGSPLFVALGVAALVAFYAYVPGYETFWSLDLVARKMAELTNQNVFLAVPFFVLSGAIMSAGGISRRLVELAKALFGWMRGGLAIASVIACVIFAAISGSAPVTLIAIGGIVFPHMVKEGYRTNFASGLITSAGSLGMLIPPSVPMLIYAISVSGLAAVNVGEMFLAGVLPGLLIAALLCVYAFFVSGVPGQPFSWPALRTAFREGIWALMMPGVILGGIYGGFFTPTEAAAVSVVYALFVEFVIHRELDPRKLPEIVVDSVRAMGTLVMIIMLSMSLNAFMVEKELGQMVLEQLKGWGLGPVGFLLALNVFLLFIGMVMDSISAIVLFTPLLVPVAVGLGIDPLHVGIIVIINLEIGYMTPPVGANLFVAAGLFRLPFGQVIRSVVPTVGIITVGLLLVTYIPTLATGPVYAMRGESFVRPLVPHPERGSAQPALAGEAVTDEAPGKVMTLEEMMRANQARVEAEIDRQLGGEGADDDGPVAPAGKVLTLEEMMRLNQTKVQAEIERQMGEREAGDSEPPETAIGHAEP